MKFAILGQRDSRWGSKPLGNSTNSTIGMYGCLCTCYAMLAGCNVDTMNDALVEAGGFQSEPRGAWMATTEVPAMANEVNLLGQSNRYDVLMPDGLLKKLHMNLADGHAAILMVDPTPGNPGMQNGEQHWVLAVGETPDGEIIIHDPWLRDVVVLTSRYGKTEAEAVYLYRTYAVQERSPKA